MRAIVAVIVLVTLLVPLAPYSAIAQTTEADVYVAQAIVDFDEKRYDAAMENLRHALEVEPDHIEALYYSGVVNLARRRPHEALSFLQRARQKSPTDPSVAFQLGLTHFAIQQYDQAAPLLEEVYSAQPTLDALGYYVGFLRYRRKDYRGALAAFETGRATDADIQQLTRFYTGLALAVLGLPTQAVAAVEQALKLAPGSALTGPAERLRDTIAAAQAKTRRFSSELRLGFTYDDNVSVVPKVNNREPLVETLRQADHESTGDLLGLRGDYKWIGAGAGPGINSDKWESTVGLSFFGIYQNDLPSFNVQNYLGNVGLTRKLSLFDLQAQSGAQYSYDVLYLRQKEFVRRHTATSFFALVEPKIGLGPLGAMANVTQVFGRYQKKTFPPTEPPPADRDKRSGQNYMIGLLHIFGFQGNRHLLKAGYQYDYDNVEGKNFVYHGHRILGGAQYTLPERLQNIRLKWDVDAHIRDYGYGNSSLPSTTPGRNRQDQEITSSVRAEWPLPDRWNNRPCTGTGQDKTCVGWTLSAEYQKTRANSTIEVFDYSRNVFSLILSLTY